jgi:glycerol-3-phosphate O-acyltransferase / dihydroxyacetone phosphate acyltransferase
MVRALLDRFIFQIAYLAAHGLYRTVEVVGTERLPRHRPVIIVANHFNGAVDALILIEALGSVPRFVAKATLWRSVFVRPFLALLGLVPVYRPEDQRAGGDNTASFRRAHNVLRDAGVLAMFPEGTTHDRLELARVRTGAARIALGAREAGITDIVIVPVGLTFDDKLALRSRALVRIGTPIDIDAELTDLTGGRPADDDDREAVGRLTGRIEERLRSVTPSYSGPRARAVLNMAAEIRLRGNLREPLALVALADREAIAQALAVASERARSDVIGALGIYNLYLDVYRLRDDQLVPRVRRRWLLRHALTLSLYLGLLGVVMVIGTAVNALPTLVVASAGRRPAAPVTKGTVRVLAALLTFLPTWLVVSIALPLTGFWPTTLALLLLPLAGAITVGGIERAVRLTQAWTGWLGLRNARGDLEDLLAARARLCEAVDAALAGAGVRAPEVSA